MSGRSRGLRSPPGTILGRRVPRRPRAQLGARTIGPPVRDLCPMANHDGRPYHSLRGSLTRECSGGGSVAFDRLRRANPKWWVITALLVVGTIAIVAILI